MKNKLIYLIIIITFSCANIFKEVVLPNQCKRCELIDQNSRQVLWTKEGCGGENTYIERDCKVEAYDQSRGNRNLGDLECDCRTWKKEPEK